jgi:hypothetical protein
VKTSLTLDQVDLQVDAIFVFNAVAQEKMNQKGRLYCAFIGLQKAFDSVYLKLCNQC